MEKIIDAKIGIDTNLWYEGTVKKFEFSIPPKNNYFLFAKSRTIICEDRLQH